MTNGEPIDRYIDCTKLNCTERIDQAFQAETKAEIDAFIGRFGLPLGFRLVYTPTRRAERIGMAGQNWLIYDQYLGQTMNLLNRIFIEATGPHAGLTYFHKYFAERSLDLGCPVLGVAFANIYHEGRDILKSRRIDEAWRGAMTVVNESFAIYHELGHEIFDLDHSYVRFLKGHVAELIRHRRESFTAETSESVLARYAVVDPATYHHIDFETFKANTILAYESEYGKKVRATYLAQIDNPDTAVELFCDAVAVDGALARAEGLLPLERAIRAIYIGSYHLKTMSYVDWHCLQILHHKTTWDVLERHDQSQLQSIQVRTHCLKSHLLFAYESRLHETDVHDVEARSKEMERMLMLDQKRYYETILDPVGSFMRFVGKDGQLDDFAEQILEDFPDRGDAEMTQLVATLAILQQTGWPATLVNAQFEAALQTT